jgi:hypothetical protein
MARRSGPSAPANVFSSGGTLNVLGTITSDVLVFKRRRECIVRRHRLGCGEFGYGGRRHGECALRRAVLVFDQSRRRYYQCVRGRHDDLAVSSGGMLNDSGQCHRVRRRHAGCAAWRHRERHDRQRRAGRGGRRGERHMVNSSDGPRDGARPDHWQHGATVGSAGSNSSNRAALTADLRSGGRGSAVLREWRRRYAAARRVPSFGGLVAGLDATGSSRLNKTSPSGSSKRNVGGVDAVAASNWPPLGQYMAGS